MENILSFNENNCLRYLDFDLEKIDLAFVEQDSLQASQVLVQNASIFYILHLCYCRNDLTFASNFHLG